MPTKNTAAGFEFLVEALKADKNAAYADLREKAEAKGLTVFPIMFGRAKSMLGLLDGKSSAATRSARHTAGARAKRPAAMRATKPGAKRGPGRPRGSTTGGSKSERIRELLSSGKTAAEIAKEVGCTVGLVYNVKSTSGGGRKARAAGQARGGSGTTARAGRRGGRKGASTSSLSANGSIEQILATLQEQAKERDRLVRALEKVREVVESLA